MTKKDYLNLARLFREFEKLDDCATAKEMRLCIADSFATQEFHRNPNFSFEKFKAAVGSI